MIAIIQALGRIGDPTAEPYVRAVREGTLEGSVIRTGTLDAYERLRAAAEREGR